MRFAPGFFAAACLLAQVAGTRAVVGTDKLPVYTQMSSDKPPVRMLERGEVIVIGLVLFGDEVTWCAVTRPDEKRRLGYVSCEFLEPERPGASAPEKPKERPAAPAPVREVQVHHPRPSDLEPEAAPPVPPLPAPAQLAPVWVFTGPPPSPPVPIERSEPVAPPPPLEPEPEPLLKKREPVAVAASLPPSREPPPSPAPSRLPPPEKLTQSMLDGTGMAAEITRFVRSSRLLSFIEKNRLEEYDTSAVDRVVRRHFQASAYSQALSDHVRRDLRGADAALHGAALHTWIESPLAVRVNELVRRAAAPESRQELVDFAEGLKESPPPESRLVLIHRLYDATKVNEMEVESVIALVGALAESLNPGLPPEKRFQRADLDRALSEVRSTYLTVMKNARLVQFLFTFRSLRDDELEEYVQFWESDTGRWLTAIFEKGFASASRGISRGLAGEIAMRLKVSR